MAWPARTVALTTPRVKEKERRWGEADEPKPLDWLPFRHVKVLLGESALVTLGDPLAIDLGGVKDQGQECATARAMSGGVKRDPWLDVQSLWGPRAGPWAGKASGVR